MNQKKLDNLHKLIKLSSKSFHYFFESGLKNFKFADPLIHEDLFELAESHIKKIESNEIEK